MTKRLRQGKGALRLLVLLSMCWYTACARQPVAQPLAPTAAPSPLASPNALYQTGLTHLSSGEYLQARLSLEQAIALAPNQTNYHNALGLANLQLGRLPQAEDAFRAALKLQRDFPDAYNNLGVTLAQEGKWEEAIVAFDQVLRFLAYNSPEIVHQNLGWAYYNLGRYPEAESALTMALRLDPKLPVTHYTLGLTWEKTGRVQEAREAYRHVLQLVPRDSETGRKAQERLHALGS
jgi:type IV pilus biogenesis/stability protein PilW